MTVAGLVMSIPLWLIGLGCYLVALVSLWRARNGYSVKRWPRRIKAINWLVMGTFYFYMCLFNPAPGEVRVYFRAAVVLLVLGEVAYHADTLLNIAEVITGKAKRLTT